MFFKSSLSVAVMLVFQMAFATAASAATSLPDGLPPFGQIVNAASDLCLDSSSDGLVQEPCASTATQDFIFVPTSEANQYYIKQLASSNCIQVSESTPGPQFQLGNCSTADAFLFTKNAAGNYVFTIPSHNNLCTQIPKSSKEPGAPFIQWWCDGGQAKEAWSIKEQIPTPIQGQNYVLTFDDEFVKNDISSSNVFDGSQWYNGVTQCCLSDTLKRPTANYPTKIDGVSVDPYSINDYGLGITLSLVNKDWFSGVMDSADKNGKGFSQKYGYFEARMKLPAGQGEWPAFWMLPLKSTTAPAEIDIIEEHGITPTEFTSTIHNWKTGTETYHVNVVGDQTEGFHTYGLLWNEQTMTFYFDGAAQWTTPTPAWCQQPMFLLLDMGLGAGFATNDTPPSNTLQISYVRVWAQP